VSLLPTVAALMTLSAHSLTDGLCRQLLDRQWSAVKVNQTGPLNFAEIEASFCCLTRVGFA
jgi:hypothetical protein